MENKEGISFKNKLWLILREELCNGTTDCENSPECATEDGCQPDDLAVKLDSLFQQKLAEKKEELIQEIDSTTPVDLTGGMGDFIDRQEVIEAINKVFNKPLQGK